VFLIIFVVIGLIIHLKHEYFDYLVELRDSGETNMWGAAPYLETAFGLSRSDARKVLIAWIESFEK
jgi:hypothetical protein